MDNHEHRVSEIANLGGTKQTQVMIILPYKGGSILFGYPAKMDRILSHYSFGTLRIL